MFNNREPIDLDTAFAPEQPQVLAADRVALVEIGLGEQLASARSARLLEI